MKTELEMLTSSISWLMMTRPVYPGTDMLTQIKKECERLKGLFHNSFNHAPDCFKLREVMNTRHTKLVVLANNLWERASLPNHIARSALLEVLTLKDFIAYEYGNFLDESCELATFERYKLKNQVLAEFRLIKVQLHSKKISAPLVLQLEKAFLDLFNETNYPVLYVSTKKFVDGFLRKLSAMASNESDKNWNMRLRQLLIKSNCNHMGIYKLLEKEHEHQILLIRDAEKQQDLLYAKQIWIDQIQAYGKLAYNKDASDLKSMLLKHIKTLGPHLAKKNKLRKIEKPEKVKYNLSVDELSLIFHYHCDENIYDYSSKRAAAEAFCEHNRSIGTADISVNSFLNIDSLKQRSAATKYYQRNSRILKQVKKDFDL